MKGFASIEKDGHAGELGSTGILIGDVKFQVRLSMSNSSLTAASGSWVQCQQAVHTAHRLTQHRLRVTAVVMFSTAHGMLVWCDTGWGVLSVVLIIAGVARIPLMQVVAYVHHAVGAVVPRMVRRGSHGWRRGLHRGGWHGMMHALGEGWWCNICVVQ